MLDLGYTKLDSRPTGHDLCHFRLYQENAVNILTQMSQIIPIYRLVHSGRYEPRTGTVRMGLGPTVHVYTRYQWVSAILSKLYWLTKQKEPSLIYLAMHNSTILGTHTHAIDLLPLVPDHVFLFTHDLVMLHATFNQGFVFLNHICKTQSYATILNLLN